MAKKISLYERALAKNSRKQSFDILQRKKLKFEIREKRFWFLTAFAPYITILVTATGLLGTFWYERDATRHQYELEQNRNFKEREADKAQAERFFVQLQENRREADESRQQSERHHQEELFDNAVGQLGSIVPMERVAAIDALSEFSQDPEFRDRAVSSLAALLEADTDPSTEAALYKAFDLANGSDLNGLVRANIQAQVLLARSYGRYVGIEMGRKFPGALDEYPSSDHEKEQSDYERQMIINKPVPAVYYHRRPVEEFVSHEFIRDGYWLQNFPDTQREIFNGEKYAAWGNPPKDFTSEQELALSGIRHGARYLELTSSIIEKLLRQHTARVSGWDLTGVYFVVPDLRGLDLHGIILSKAHLEMADLRGTNLTDATCIGTNFDGANFSGAKLISVNLNDANLDQIQPFPIDTPRGYNHTFTSPNSPEELRFKGANFKNSSWRNARSISNGLRVYLNTNF